MRYCYTAIITEDEGKYHVRFPDLDGCITSGKDLYDAMDMAEDALACWLCVAEDTGKKIPSPTALESLSIGKGDYPCLVKADTMKYRQATDTKAVRKNVSLPMWLAKIVEQRKINCSKVLQDALMSQIQ